jgi:pyruvate dehydrogenase E1 component alpha subunit
LTASSGIVGSSGPAAAGFALAARRLKPGRLAVAFFGEGAMNEGMLLESFNLAVVWKLPVIFVCKDDKWSITTRSREFTGGTLTTRAESFDMPAYSINGVNIQEVWTAASRAMTIARSGAGPSFIHAACQHQEGHFLGDPFLRSVRKPFRELPGITYPLLKSSLQFKGAGVFQRLESFTSILAHLGETIRSRTDPAKDPVRMTRSLLEDEPHRLASLEEEVFRNMADLLSRIVGE